jgi:pyridoxine/pyridoxamine 5'-phosphate oxidase
MHVCVAFVMTSCSFSFRVFLHSPKRLIENISAFEASLIIPSCTVVALDSLDSHKCSRVLLLRRYRRVSRVDLTVNDSRSGTSMQQTQQAAIVEDYSSSSSSSTIQGKSVRQQRLTELKQTAYFRKRELVRLSSSQEIEPTTIVENNNHDEDVPRPSTPPGYIPLVLP